MHFRTLVPFSDAEAAASDKLPHNRIFRQILAADAQEIVQELEQPLCLNALCELDLRRAVPGRKNPAPVSRHVGVFHVELPAPARLHGCDRKCCRKAALCVLDKAPLVQDLRAAQIAAPGVVVHRRDHCPHSLDGAVYLRPYA